MSDWIQNKLPELQLALGYHHSWCSNLVFVYRDILGRTQAYLYASDGKAKMWWVLRDAQIGERESLGSVWGWLPLSELPGKPPGRAAWQAKEPKPPEEVIM